MKTIGIKDITRLTDKAKRVIPVKVVEYSEKMGIGYGRITIRH